MNNTLTALDRYIEVLIENFSELEFVSGINEAIEREDYDWLYPHLQKIVEPELTNPEVRELIDDPEVSEFIDSIGTGEFLFVEFCSKYGITNSTSVAVAKFLDENGY